MTKQEETNLQILRRWAMPNEIRTKLKTSSLKSYRKIATMNPDDIIARAKKIMEYWTGNKMDSYMGTEYYNTSELSSKDQLLRVWVYTNDFEDIETCLQVYRLFKRIGVEITLQQAEFVWSYISDKLMARWLCKYDDIECWMSILISFLFDQPTEVEELIK